MRRLLAAAVQAAPRARALGGAAALRPGRRALCATSSSEPPGAGAGGGSSSTVEGEGGAKKLDVVWQLRELADELPPAVRQAFSRENMSASELAKLDVQAAISRWARFDGDTGSSEVQVAIFSERIRLLSEHMKAHHKDQSTKRRLQLLVLKRNRMLKYMRRADRPAYNRVLEQLGIRPTRMFDPTMGSHPMGSLVTGWAKKGSNWTPKKRQKRAVPYGDEKRAKGRANLRKHAVRQRRLQKNRAAAAKAQAAAEAAEARS